MIRGTLASGMWPTMITAFGDDGKLDFKANAALTDWLIKKGSSGLFSVCMSSEMFFLTLQEKIDLAKCVVDAAGGRVPVVASGHTSNSMENQVEELDKISETGVDVTVMVSNRLATKEQGEEILLENMKLIMNALPDVIFGMYECPYPFLRLLTLNELSVIARDSRMRFLKDVSCDTAIQHERMQVVGNTSLGLYNAQSETVLESLKAGYVGFSGIMGNYHIDIYRWLYDNWESDSDTVIEVQNWLTWAYTVHQDSYPVSAKYHMNLEGIPFPLNTRSKKVEVFTPQLRCAIEKLKVEEDKIRRKLGINC